jgi:putative transposase
MTTAAEDDQWSSAHFSLGIAADPTLSPHSAYLALGADPAGRATSYRQWLNQGVTGE